MQKYFSDIIVELIFKKNSPKKENFCHREQNWKIWTVEGLKLQGLISSEPSKKIKEVLLNIYIQILNPFLKCLKEILN